MNDFISGFKVILNLICVLIKKIDFLNLIENYIGEVIFSFKIFWLINGKLPLLNCSLKVIVSSVRTF